jgi:hypothetical protein
LVTYAVSVVSEKPDAETGKIDRFTKAEGRDLAHARLTIPNDDSDPEIQRGYCFNLSPEASNTEVIGFIMDELKDYSWVPSRVRKAAQKWIDCEDQ